MARRKKSTLSSPILSAVLLILLVALAIYYGVHTANTTPPGAPGIPTTPAAGAATPSPSAGAPGLAAQDGLTIHYLPVGKADAHLLISGDETMLIDGGTGKTEEQLAQYLRSQGIERLTYVIATHPHEDHIGGLDHALDEFGAQTVFVSYAEHTTRAYENLLLAIAQSGAQLTAPKPGDSFTFGQATCTFLAPLRENYTEMNDASLVLRIELGENSFLFTGDAETASERDMADAYGDALHSDVLKVAHHGSNSSSVAAFLDAVSPTYAVIPSGLEADDEGPSKKVLSRLKKRNIIIYRTSEGVVLCHSDGSSIRFEVNADSFPKKP